MPLGKVVSQWFSWFNASVNASISQHASGRVVKTRRIIEPQCMIANHRCMVSQAVTFQTSKACHNNTSLPRASQQVRMPATTSKRREANRLSSAIATVCAVLSVQTVAPHPALPRTDSSLGYLSSRGAQVSSLLSPCVLMLYTCTSSKHTAAKLLYSRPIDSADVTLFAQYICRGRLYIDQSNDECGLVIGKCL